MSESPYSSFIAVAERCKNKRGIHKCDISTGSADTRFYLFLQARIIPHRSKGGYALNLIFVSDRYSVVRTEITTHTGGDGSEHGAVGDALYLASEIVAAWTSIVEAPK